MTAIPTVCEKCASEMISKDNPSELRFIIEGPVVGMHFALEVLAKSSRGAIVPGRTLTEITFASVKTHIECKACGHPVPSEIVGIEWPHVRRS